MPEQINNITGFFGSFKRFQIGIGNEKIGVGFLVVAVAHFILLGWSLQYYKNTIIDSSFIKTKEYNKYNDI